MTVILQDDEIHVGDPEQDYVANCGLEYSSHSIDARVTGALYIEDQLARMRDNYPDAEMCEECSASLID